MDVREEVKEYLQLFSRNFRDNIDSHVEMFLETVSNYFVCTIGNGEIKADEPNPPSQTDTDNELKRLQAELEAAHALIFVLKGALQLSNAVSKRHLKKK